MQSVNVCTAFDAPSVFRMNVLTRWSIEITFMQQDELLQLPMYLMVELKMSIDQCQPNR